MVIVLGTQIGSMLLVTQMRSIDNLVKIRQAGALYLVILKVKFKVKVNMRVKVKVMVVVLGHS